MEHSKNYQKVKRYYDMKMWEETRVRNAVKMGWITEAEFQEITGTQHAAGVHAEKLWGERPGAFRPAPLCLWKG